MTQPKIHFKHPAYWGDVGTFESRCGRRYWFYNNISMDDIVENIDKVTCKTCLRFHKIDVVKELDE